MSSKTIEHIQEPQDLSEYRSSGLLVQVCGYGDPETYAMYGRQAQIDSKGQWSVWERIDDEMFRYMDKQARIRLGENSNSTPLYAEMYHALIS